MSDQTQGVRIPARETVEPERINTVVVGGGQAGLAVGYHLAEHGLPFVILDASERIGDSWRKRWDSLRLFSPAAWNGLPGMPFPAPPSSYPAKDEVADYLEAYASKFELPVRNGVKVDRLQKAGDQFTLTAGDQRFEADNVVVAMATHQKPWVPPFASELKADVVQIHSSEYKNPSDLREGGVLVVGAGNSGAEISLELSSKHQTWLSGRETGHVPFRIDTLAARLFLLRMVRFVGHNVLTVKTPIGRKMRAKLLSSGSPLVRVKPKDLVDAGIERVPKVAGVRDGLPMLEDERVLDVANVIWCTGFRPGFSWIDLPVFGEDKHPLHERGIVADVPGLYFVGLLFLYAMTSSFLAGVGRDAKRVAEHIVARAD